MWTQSIHIVFGKASVVSAVDEHRTGTGGKQPEGNGILPKPRARRSRKRAGGSNTRKTYNCEPPNFTMEHINVCPATNATCIVCRKLGQFEKTCRGIFRKTNHWKGRGRVGLVHEEQEHHRSSHSMEGNAREQPVKWVNQEAEGEYDSSTGISENMLMAIKRDRKEIEFKIPNAKVLATVWEENVAIG